MFSLKFRKDESAFAYHGHRVKVYDNNLPALNSAYSKLDEDMKQLRDEGLLLHKRFIGQVLFMGRLEETVNDADFIFEAVIEDLEVKKDLLERVSHLCKPDAVIASNTLRLSISDVAERAINKERVIGVRFLFPVYYIPEVEIKLGSETSAATLEKVRVVLERMGKTLFFRSGEEPLILSEDQREERKNARLEQIKITSGVDFHLSNGIPMLSHRGNVAPLQDDIRRLNSVEIDHDCAICLDRLRDCLLQPCHHMVTCCNCASLLINRRDGCPICRQNITEIIRVYHS
ncbi:hypothetical protein ACJMK2_036996 [Sinanodonta woodiana]|uniref:RING-type domain-containing protein n=1 Tax=Sinanodonta woodiana TaxID=1069815 RepID=A0ABD3WIW5_SINWO